MRCAVVFLLLIAIGCTTDPPASGVLVRATSDGTLHVHNYLSGLDSTYPPTTGTASSLALSPGGRVLAWRATGGDGSEHLMVADLVGALAYEVQRTTLGFSELHWGGGAVFWFWGDGRHVFVVPYGARAARQVGTGGAAWALASDTGPYIAVSVCDDPTATPPGCASHVVVESGEGDLHYELPSPASEPYAFTPDNAALLVLEPTTDGLHLARYELATAARTDLGRAAGEAAPLSLDGSEAIVTRSEGVIAVAIDGSGERVVLATIPSGFHAPVLTPHGLLYEVGADAYLDTQLAAALQPSCQRVVSATREHAAWSCDDGLHVVSTSARTLQLFSQIRGPALGFDAEERGVVLGGVRATYVTLDGDHVDLGEAGQAVYNPIAVD